MFTRRTLLTLLVALGTTAALVAGPAPAPAQPSRSEANRLAKCQATIARSGQNYVSTTLKLLEECGTARVEADLKCSADAGNCQKLQDQATALCAKNFEKVLPASTKLVDGVIKACKPVEDAIFDESDPLATQVLAQHVSDVFDAIFGADSVAVSVGSVEELAGLLCASKTLLVDIMAFMQVPNGLTFLELLSQHFTNLDARCLGEQ